MTNECKWKSITLAVILIAFIVWAVDESYTVGYLNGMQYVQDLRR